MTLKWSKCFLTVFLLLSMILSVHGQKGKKGVNWPSFRGQNARGIAEDVSTPVSWDVENSKNIKWKTPIPAITKRNTPRN